MIKKLKFLSIKRSFEYIRYKHTLRNGKIFLRKISQICQSFYTGEICIYTCICDQHVKFSVTILNLSSERYRICGKLDASHVTTPCRFSRCHVRCRVGVSACHYLPRAGLLTYAMSCEVTSLSQPITR